MQQRKYSLIEIVHIHSQMLIYLTNDELAMIHRYHFVFRSSKLRKQKPFSDHISSDCGLSTRR